MVVCFIKINAANATGRAMAACPSGVPELIPVLGGSWREIFSFLCDVLWVIVFPFDRYVVCLSSICNFWLSFWCPQTFLMYIQSIKSHHLPNEIIGWFVIITQYFSGNSPSLWPLISLLSVRIPSVVTSFWLLLSLWVVIFVLPEVELYKILFCALMVQYNTLVITYPWRTVILRTLCHWICRCFVGALLLWECYTWSKISFLQYRYLIVLSRYCLVVFHKCHFSQDPFLWHMKCPYALLLQYTMWLFWSLAYKTTLLSKFIKRLSFIFIIFCVLHSTLKSNDWCLIMYLHIFLQDIYIFNIFLCLDLQ